MDTTLAPSAAIPAVLPGDKPAARAPLGLDRLLALPGRTKIGLALAIAALTAVIALALAMGNRTEWRVLYANLSDKDGGAVIAALSQMNVPHKFADGGGAILIPESQVHEVRLRLASQGLPKGGAVGFELMENQKFGTTQFQERLNFQRGLEGELARSIMALAAVQSARIHLALPQQTAFLREQQKPSASVLLTLHAGRTLDRSQIAGIVHLVASSVPDLHPKAVSVLDQTGSLLSQEGAEAPNGLDAAQLRHVRQTEQNLASRILAIVEPIVGPGNVKAQVTADLDFTQSESTAELFAPNQGKDAPQAIRSQHLSESAGGAGAGAGGIPGALANQPPATPASPVNGAPQALSAGGAAGGTSSNKRDAVTNYEVDKTVRVTRSATGAVRRLNAAVVVNHQADAKGAAQALSAEQMEQINALVREAIGYSKERGDSVNVVNAAFRGPVEVAIPPTPLWKQREVIDLARNLAPWIALPLVALMVIFGLVRPALRASRATAQEGSSPARLLDATVHDAVPLPTPGDQGVKVSVNMPDVANGLPGATPGVPLLPTAQAAAQHARNAQLENIRQLARQNPATIANVVRNWVTPQSQS